MSNTGIHLDVHTRTTVGAGVLVLRDDKLLMVRQERASGMRWEVPSGGQEPGETLEEAAAREAWEEAGVAVDIGRVVSTYSSFRPFQGSAVIGAMFLATLTHPDAVLVPQLDDGIVAAEFVDPLSLPRAEVGRLTSLVLERWWPTRHAEHVPFHVELLRAPSGYHSVDSGTGELVPLDI